MAEGWRVSEDVPKRRGSRVVWLLTLVPFWLVASTGVGIWLYLKHEKKEAEAERARFASPVSAKDLSDDVGKLIGFAGERHPGTAEGVQGLNRAAAMIEGSLGAGNAGFRVERIHGPVTPSGKWPLLMVTVHGSSEKLPPLWVVAAYDSRPGSPGAEANATGVASTLAVARALATSTPERTIRFAFIPHGCDPDSPVVEGLDLLRKKIGEAHAVLSVEAMGGGKILWVSSREAENPVFPLVPGLGEVVGAEAICLEDDFDLASASFEAGLPAVRISTRSLVKEGEDDSNPPEPEVHEASTRALVELIRRLAMGT